MIVQLDARFVDRNKNDQEQHQEDLLKLINLISFSYVIKKFLSENIIPTKCLVNVLLGLGGRKCRKHRAKINANISERIKLN